MFFLAKAFNIRIEWLLLDIAYEGVFYLYFSSLILFWFKCSFKYRSTTVFSLGNSVTSYKPASYRT